MRYVNPFELLQIAAENLSDADSSTINRAKRKLLAELELSDTKTIAYAGVELSKGDCLRAIDDLDNRDKKEFHFFIYQHKHLKQFLSTGKLSFFENYQAESIYKLPEFLDFISPFFSEQYDILLSQNFKSGRAENVTKLLSVKPITNEGFFEKCYKSTYTFIIEIDKEINDLNKDITSNTSPFINKKFVGLDKVILARVNVQLLNLLPSYFQSLRNQLAFSIRNLSVKINNDYELYEPAFKIIEIANAISTDALSKQSITKGYYAVKKNFDKLYQVKSVSNSSTTSQQTTTEEKKQTEVEKKGITAYTITLLGYCVLLFWSLFNDTIRFYMLLFSALYIAFRFYHIVKHPDNLKKSRPLDTFLFFASTVICFGGFFSFALAILFISYNLLMWGHSLYYDLFYNRPYRNDRSFGYLLVALIITFLFSAYQKSHNKTNTNSISSNIENSTEKYDVQIDDTFYFGLGRALFNEKKYADAIPKYSEALKLNPRYAEAFIARGACKANLGHYEDAIADYDSASSLGCIQAVLYSNLGVAYYHLHKLEEAYKYYSSAISMDSTYAYAYKGRGDIKYDKNDNKGAIADFTEAIKYNASNSSYYFARGLAYYYLRNYKSAIDDIDKAIDLNPNNAQYYYDRGDVKTEMSDLMGACNDWKIAKEKGYSVPDYKINRCTVKTIYVSNGNFEGCTKFNSVYASPSIDNSLKISAGANASVAVKLVNLKTNRCIRYFFVGSNSSYTARNIPEGKYFLKIAYGNDWYVMGNQSICEGKFMNNVLFKRSDRDFDFNLIETGTGFQIPYYELRLNVITTFENTDTKFSASQIKEKDFYNE